MRKLNKLIGCIILMLSSTAALTNEADWKDHVLLVAEPSNVEFVKPPNCPKGKLCIGDIYSVELKNISILRGKFSKKNLNVEIVGSQKESITLNKKIIVLLNNSGKTPRAINWTIPYSVACFPSNLVEGTEMESAFYIEDNETKYSGNEQIKRVCTNAEWF
jgi:hypothetical protein